MSSNHNNLSEAKMLAALVARGAQSDAVSASIQRSHRFPIHVLSYIEGMAELGGVSVSLVINQLLEAGLEAVQHEFPDDIKKTLRASQGKRLQIALEKLNETKSNPKK